MNEEDEEYTDLPFIDEEDVAALKAPRPPASSIIDGPIWQDQIMNQLRVNSPTAGFMQQVSNTTASPSIHTDTFSAAPHRPDFERIRDHLVEDLEHVFTYDEKFGDVIAMPKAVAQALLNYLNWELQGGTMTASWSYPGSVMQVLEQMQSWINMGPSQDEIQKLQARMPRRMESNMYPLIKLLDMLREARMRR